MPDKLELESLAERCEGATEGDRELDAKIAIGSGAKAVEIHADSGDAWMKYEVGRRPLPRYTASLDDAWLLVSEGWRLQFLQEIEFIEHVTKKWTVDLRERDGFGHVQVWAQTPSLALCAAALRSLQTVEDSRG